MLNTKLWWSALLLLILAIGVQASYIIGPPPAIFPSTSTPVFIQAATPNASGSSTTSSSSFSALPVIAHAVMVGVTTVSGTIATQQLSTVSDNQGNTYSRMTDAGGNTTNTHGSWWCGVVTVSSGTFTVTVTNLAAVFQGILPLEYSGMSCNQDRNANAITSTSPYNCGSITTVNAKDVVFAFFALADGGGAPNPVTYTPSAGFTIRSSLTDANKIPIGSVADDVVSTAGTFTPTMTSNTASANNPCITVAMLSK